MALLGPLSGANLEQSARTLSWQAIDRAEAYRVGLSQSATFATGVTSVVE